MKIGTVLPTFYLSLEKRSDYHLCLAHQVEKDPRYEYFYRDQAVNGSFVILDNGIVETGTPLPIEDLVRLADRIKCQEMVLPDSLFNSSETLRGSYHALSYISLIQQIRKRKLMVVPQGKTPEEWISCVKDMLSWDVDTFGITRFLVPRVFISRLEALRRVPELIDSTRDIHLLGCPEFPTLSEISEIDKTFPGRIRGIDSGIAAIYAQNGLSMASDIEKPCRTIDLDTKSLDYSLLKDNIRIWKEECQWKP